MSTQHRYLYLLALISAFGVAGCATSESEPGNEKFVDAGPKDEIVCRRERPVGSHVPRDVCYSRRESEENQRRALEALGPLRTMSGSLPTPPSQPPTNPN